MLDIDLERARRALIQLGTALDEVRGVVPLEPALNPKALLPLTRGELLERLLGYAHEKYEEKEQASGAENMRTLERLVMLGTIDRLWVEHLTALDEMRQGIGLQGYGGRDPLVEFKREAHDMYEQLKEHIRQNVVRRIFHVTLVPPAAPQPPRQVQETGPAKETTNAAAGRGRGATAAATATATAAPPSDKVGRNDPCPCGSGKKFKKCHGGTGIAA